MCFNDLSHAGTQQTAVFYVHKFTQKSCWSSVFPVFFVCLFLYHKYAAGFIIVGVFYVKIRSCFESRILGQLRFVLYFQAHACLIVARKFPLSVTQMTSLHTWTKNLFYCQEFISNSSEKFSIQMYVVNLISTDLIRPLEPLMWQEGWWWWC